MQGDFSRHSDRFALVLLSVGKLRSTRSGDKGCESLIRVFAAHVQKNVASARLMNTIDFVGDRCDFADVLCRFGSGVSCRGLRNG